MGDYSMVGVAVWPWPEDDAELRKAFEDNDLPLGTAGYEWDKYEAYFHTDPDTGENTMNVTLTECSGGASAVLEGRWNEVPSLADTFKKHGLSFEVVDDGSSGAWGPSVYRWDASTGREFTSAALDGEPVVDAWEIAGWFAEGIDGAELPARLCDRLGITEELIEKRKAHDAAFASARARLDPDEKEGNA